MPVRTITVKKKTVFEGSETPANAHGITDFQEVPVAFLGVPVTNYLKIKKCP